MLPQPFLCLAAGIAAFGTLAGRRHRGPSNLRTNFYCVGLALSGAGKNHPLVCASKLLIEADRLDMVGGDGVKSGTALVALLKAQPSALLTIDEFGYYLQNCNARSAGARADIFDRMAKFYSMANSDYVEANALDPKSSQRDVIRQPHLCLFGVSTDGSFWDGFKARNKSDGYLARFLMFDCGSYIPGYQHDADGGARMPTSLVSIAQKVANGAVGHDTFPAGHLSTDNANPYLVPYATDVARKDAENFMARHLAYRRAAENGFVSSVMGRTVETAMKLALLHAILTNPEAPKIDSAAISWGEDIALWNEQTILVAAATALPENGTEHRRNRVMQLIAAAGPGGLKHAALLRAVKSCNAAEIESIIKVLHEAEEIDVIGKPTVAVKGGRPGTIYRASCFSQPKQD